MRNIFVKTKKMKDDELKKYVAFLKRNHYKTELSYSILKWIIEEGIIDA